MKVSALNGMSDTSAHELTTRDHWDSAWQRPPRWRLPSKLFVSTRNLQRVIEPHVQAGMRYLELGCAPGKMLAWVASDLHADVSGLDYSQRGIEWARRLFDTLGLRADLRCEDVWSTTFTPGVFDVVFSAGLIEHFDDPRSLVRLHVTLLKPGGRALITVPNYGGVYGRLQGWFDPDNLALHNLSIMSTEALARLAPTDLASSVRAYPAGRLSPWAVSIGHKWPGPIATGISLAANGLGLIQPMDVVSLCPLLVLDIVRGDEPAC
ncbi:MAG TPA: class I SAM-dependent methyltransferase [Vicinamibacterales bacterium]|nr:class I SAM-dependent methyltransferase [Vicinamibacterales bacterium]